jgi:23S rRNA pseudouridine1911/1915/1917 synthase
MPLQTKKVLIDMAGLRLDRALAELFPEFSRSKLQTWIKAGRVKVDGQRLKAKDAVRGDELIVLDAEAEAVVEYLPENIPLDIIYEDQAILIINKPAGLVVHPAVGNWQGTLLNALLNHQPELANVPRAGIVHRLDKDTSGLLMIAKTLSAHSYLVEQLQQRTIKREYLAITHGRMTAGGTVDAPIGRHQVDRKRNVVRDDGKLAVSHYRVVQRFTRHTLIRVQLETGRTHQIRVHMAHIRYPLLGDPVYGGRFRLPPDCSETLELQLRAFKRQALHATKLGLEHPQTGEHCSWEVAVPDDMQLMLEALATYDQQLDHS